jgi:hypothetical protein
MSSSTNMLPRNFPLGAYGLRISGVRGADSMLVRAAASWPAVEISVVVERLEADGEFVDEDNARIRLRTGGWIELDRDSGRARYTVPAALSPEELVHPFLAPAAAVCGHWHGRESIHGGAIALGATVWGVVGDQHAGKSSLLAALAIAGTDVVCDDVLVLDGRQAFAGPRTVDLRKDAAAALGVGDEIGLAGARERWRLQLGPLDRPLTLGGFVFVEWSDDAEMRRLPASDTLARLYRNRSIRVPPRDPVAFLQFSALPAWELRRPRSWASLPETLELLVGVLADA